MKIMSMFFLKKKNLQGKWVILGSNSFSKILHNENGQEVHENYIKGFSEKNIFGTIGPYLARK